MIDADVVISGAGPNGLLLAGELALAGVRPAVLEQLPGPSPEPKANAIVGQSNRMLDLRGLYQLISGLDQSPQPRSNYLFAGMHVPLGPETDNPMYGMVIQQPHVVERLLDWVTGLGVRVAWEHTLTGVEQHAAGVTLTVDTPGGRRRVETEYLVGADGGRSFVRKATGIRFPGVTTPTVARAAHVDVAAELRTVPGALTIPGLGEIPHGHHRFDGGVFIYAEFQPGCPTVGTIEYDSLLPDDAPPPTVDDLRASVARVTGVDIPISAPRRPGPHALHRINGQNTRQADRYRSGRVFLIGDAAHVHSPMGGPGLNLGLQDAMNLGWKLAAAVQGRAPAGLLDTYHTERWPAGQRVMIHSLARSALMMSGPEITALRTLFSEFLDTADGARHVAALLAGSDVRYDVGCQHPLAGSLLPDLTLGDGRRVAELLRPARSVLLDTSGGAHADTALDWADRLDITVTDIIDRPAASMLIRPDGYVAWAADGHDQDGLRSALRRWIGARRGECLSA